MMLASELDLLSHHRSLSLIGRCKAPQLLEADCLRYKLGGREIKKKSQRREGKTRKEKAQNVLDVVILCNQGNVFLGRREIK